MELKEVWTGLSLIVTLTSDGFLFSSVIHSELKRRAELIGGHPIILDRGYWESGPRPIAHSTNILLGRKNENRTPYGAIVAYSEEHAYSLARREPGGDQVFVLGWENAFRKFLPHAAKIYLTTVQEPVREHAGFPVLELSAFVRTEIPIAKHRWDPYETSLCVLERS